MGSGTILASSRMLSKSRCPLLGTTRTPTRMPSSPIGSPGRAVYVRVTSPKVPAPPGEVKLLRLATTEVPDNSSIEYPANTQHPSRSPMAAVNV